MNYVSMSVGRIDGLLRSLVFYRCMSKLLHHLKH